jgi:hypothetical protein
MEKPNDSQTDVAFLLYDCTDRASFDATAQWINVSFRLHLWPSISYHTSILELYELC